jgi:hypothetical protein
MILKINQKRRLSINPHTTQQQEPVRRSPEGPQTTTGQGAMTPQREVLTVFMVTKCGEELFLIGGGGRKTPSLVIVK